MKDALSKSRNIYKSILNLLFHPSAIFKISIIILLVLFPQLGFPGQEYATFETFYKPSITFDWGVGAIIAILGGVVIFFTGQLFPLYGPFITSIGTWIGNYMGFSGAAATNAGLAFLGGGTIVSGGLGKIGGMTLLTIALTFSHEVRLHYILEKIAEYNYSSLVEESINLPTLPPPINKSFSYVNEVAVNYLAKIDGTRLHSDAMNQKIIRQTIIYLEKLAPSAEGADRVNRHAFLALLYFQTNDYINAKSHAEQSINIANKYQVRHTLPLFIYATASLYDKNPNFDQVTENNLFDAIIKEPNNPLIPLMFSVYMDRLFLRLNEEPTDGKKSLAKIFSIMNILKLHQIVNYPGSVDMDTINYMSLLSRYLMLIKIEQQNILSLTSKDSLEPEAKLFVVTRVEKSLENYRGLIDDASKVFDKLKMASRDISQKIDALKFLVLLKRYKEDAVMLESLITNFK